MNPTWVSEIQRLLLLLLIAIILGALFGDTVFFLWILTAAYLAWHLRYLYRLSQWLKAGKGFQPPEASGIWDDVFEDIHRLQKRNASRKKNLRRLLKRFHKMTAAMPDAVVELSQKDQTIQWWNDAATNYLGLRYPRDVGQRISNLLRHPDLQGYLASTVEEGVEIPSPIDDDLILRILIVTYSGNRQLLIARDMTRIVQLERTRQDFIANASHELRSPLTVLEGYVEVLQYAEESCQDYRPQLETMQQQTSRMTRIVNDLMLLSRLESEIPRVDPDPVNIPELIKQIVQQARDLSGDDKHIFNTDINESLCLIGRESELYSAFSNLVFNAVRYTPAKGFISLSWQQHEDCVAFSVADTGIGIEAHHIPRLTERFYRADAGRSRAAGGTGLGLAIVKHVLMRHGGRLDIESEVEKGSKFNCLFSQDRVKPCVTR